MAISHFQLAHLSFIKHDYSGAASRYQDVIQCMRSNAVVEYGQTGLEFTLYECEVWYNHGLCQVRMGNQAAALQSFMHAHLTKRLVRHDLVDEAISCGGKDMLPFAPPDLKVYRPKRMPMMTGSLLNSMTMASGAMHTPLPSNLMNETQSRKVVAVAEGELRPQPYDFGSNMARLSMSNFSLRAATPPPTHPCDQLVKLIHASEDENCIRYTVLTTETAEGFIAKIKKKLGSTDLRLKYRDDQGDWLSLIDDDDLNSAQEYSRQRLDKLLVLKCI